MQNVKKIRESQGKLGNLREGEKIKVGVVQGFGSLLKIHESCHENMAHVEGIPEPGFPFTLFLVDHHVFRNYDRQDVFTFNDTQEDGNGNVIIAYLIGK